MVSLLQRTWNALVHPTVRLNPDFPLTGKKLGKSYFVGLIWFTVGSFAPIVLLLAWVFGAALLKVLGAESVAQFMIGLVLDAHGKVSDTMLSLLMLSSFLGGFGLELRYLSKVLQKSGHSLLASVGLSLSPIRKNTWYATVWAIAWRAVAALAVVHCFEHAVQALVTMPEQPTITFAKQLSGNSEWSFFVIAAILAPLLEEICFRGFLFQAIRATFYQWQQAAANPETAPKGKFSRLTTKLGGTLFSTAGRADVGAVFLSAAAFSLQHMQFQPVTLLMLFGMGALLAEIFRRTGTLWPGILLHALNNGLAVALLFYAQS